MKSYLRILWVMIGLGMFPVIGIAKESIITKTNALNKMSVLDVDPVYIILVQDDKNSKKQDDKRQDDKGKDAQKRPEVDKDAQKRPEVDRPKEPRAEPKVGDIDLRKPKIREVPKARPRLRPGTVTDRVKIRRPGKH